MEDIDIDMPRCTLQRLRQRPQALHCTQVSSQVSSSIAQSAGALGGVPCTWVNRQSGIITQGAAGYGHLLCTWVGREACCGVVHLADLQHLMEVCLEILPAAVLRAFQLQPHSTCKTRCSS